jgi:hypothetical protein
MFCNYEFEKTGMKFRYSADESFDIGRDSARRKAGAQLTGHIIVLL